MDNKSVSVHSLYEPIQLVGADRTDHGVEPEKSLPTNDIESIHTIEILPPPDGGTVAWLQVVAGFFCLFSSYGLVNTYGSFQQYYTTTMLANRSPSEISWVGAMFGSFAQFIEVAVGPLVDKGYIRTMAIVGCLVQCFTMMMLSLSTQYYQIILTQGVLMGIGTAVLFMAGISAVAQYFQKKRALAVGIAIAGSSIGGVVYPVSLTRLIAQVGFAWTARIVGLIVLVTGIIACVLIKQRLPPRKAGPLLDLSAAREPVMVLYAICLLFSFASQFIVMFYIQTYAVEKTNGDNISFYMTALVNAASTLGRIVPNYLADKVGAFNVMLPAVACCTVLGFAWIGISSSNGMVAFAVLYGLFSAPFISLEGAIVATLTPDLRKLGSRMSFLAIFTAVGCLIAPPMAGIVQRHYGWLWLKVMVGCCSTLALIFGVITRQVLTKGQILVKA